MRLKTLFALFITSTSLTACATFKPPAIDYDRDYAPAALNADPPQPGQSRGASHALALARSAETATDRKADPGTERSGGPGRHGQ